MIQYIISDGRIKSKTKYPQWWSPIAMPSNLTFELSFWTALESKAAKQDYTTNTSPEEPTNIQGQSTINLFFLS